MKVLLLYKYSNHYHLLSDMMDDMDSRGISIAALDIVYFNYHGHFLPKKKFFSLVAVFFSVPKLRGILLRLCRNRLIKELSKSFDVIDIQSFSSECELLINELCKVKKKIFVTYWGSDLFRASNEELEKHINLFKHVNLIRTTSPAAYKKVKSMKLPVPIRMCRFGLGNLEQIKEIAKESRSEWLNRLSFLPRRVAQKTLVVIGNNGSKAQQHVKVIHELTKLQDELQDIFLLLPASYGFDREYKQEIESALNATSIEYVIVESFLNRDQLNSLVLLTDIFITAQTTDAFSAFVQEHLAAGTVVLAGKWLPYFILRNEGICIYEYSWDSFVETFKYIYSNFSDIKSRIKIENSKMFEISSWGTLGQCWNNSYKLIEECI